MSSNFDSIKLIKGKVLKSIEFAQEKDDNILNRVRLNFGTSAMDVCFCFHPRELCGKIINVSELNFVPVKLHMPFETDSIEPIQVRMVDEKIKSVSALYQSINIQNIKMNFCNAISINCEFRKYEIYKQSIFDNKIYINNVNDSVGGKIPTKELIEIYKGYIHDSFSLAEIIKQ